MSALDQAIADFQAVTVLVGEQLIQCRDALPFHVEGSGLLHAVCLKCAEDWPCRGYAEEVGDL